MNKQAIKNNGKRLYFFPRGKKGMEMWMLVLMILAILLLIFVVAWYSGLNMGIESMFNKLGSLM